MHSFKFRLAALDSALLFAFILLISLPSPANAIPAANPGPTSSANLMSPGNGAEGDKPPVVRGTVADPSGAIVPNAEVDLLDGTGAVAATLHSDGEGNFQLLAPALGDYTLVVSEAGFDTVKTVVKLAKQGPVTAPIQ